MYTNLNSNLDLWYFNPKTITLIGYPKVILYTKFEHFGSFVFELYCGQTNRQTDKQKVPNLLPTSTDQGNNNPIIIVKKSLNLHKKITVSQWINSNWYYQCGIIYPWQQYTVLLWTILAESEWIIRQNVWQKTRFLRCLPK